MTRRVKGIGIGTTSLVMIFSVLCLTFFAILTFSTANAEDIMSEKSSIFVKNYYAADSRATKIHAEILSSASLGVIPGSVDGIELDVNVADDGTTIGYSCPVNDAQELVVCFKIENTGCDILIWELEPTEEWATDEALTVWDGSFE